MESLLQKSLDVIPGLTRNPDLPNSLDSGVCGNDGYGGVLQELQRVSKIAQCAGKLSGTTFLKSDIRHPTSEIPPAFPQKMAWRPKRWRTASMAFWIF